MPSGSHGGNAGGHGGLSGGFSSSHSSSGGSSQSNFHGRIGHGPSRIHYFHFGGSYYVFGSRIGSFFSLLSSLIFVFLFGAIIGGIVLVSANSTINEIKKEDRYYKNMVTYALQHEEYIRDAVVTDNFERYGKMYYTYDVYDTVSVKDKQGNPVPVIRDGYTFSLYDETEIFMFPIGSTIKVAVNANPITANTDSVPMTYINESYENDGAYIAALTQKKIGLAVLIISIAIDVTIFATCIILIKKKAKKKSESELKNIKSNSDNYCPYCATKVDSKDKRCPSCGASLK